MVAKALSRLSHYEKNDVIAVLEYLSEQTESVEHLEEFIKKFVPIIQDLERFISETKHLFPHGSDPALPVHMHAIFGSEGVKKFEQWWKYFSQIKGRPNDIYKEIISWMEYFDDPETAWAYREEGYNPAGAARLEFS